MTPHEIAAFEARGIVAQRNSGEPGAKEGAQVRARAAYRRWGETYFDGLLDEAQQEFDAREAAKAAQKPNGHANGAAEGKFISDNHYVAVTWAHAGVSVFPCKDFPSDKEQDKRPLTMRGFHDATTDEQSINFWWSENPGALPAISCGAANLFVADPDRHGGPDGVENFDSLAKENGQRLEDFASITTSSGGMHIYFRQPDGEPLGNGEGELKNLGINFRGRGGYVIAPGARRADGRQWGTSDENNVLYGLITGGQLKPPPQWLIDKIKSTKRRARSESDTPVTDRERAYAAKALKGAAAEMDAALPGHRNNTLNAIAFRMGRFIGAGWIERDVVEDALLKACAHDDNQAKAQDTMRRAIDAGMDDPIEPLEKQEAKAEAGASGGQSFEEWLKAGGMPIVDLIEARRIEKRLSHFVLEGGSADVTAQDAGAAMTRATGRLHLSGKVTGTIVRLSTGFADKKQVDAQREALGNRAADLIGVGEKELRVVRCSLDELTLQLQSRIAVVRQEEMPVAEQAECHVGEGRLEWVDQDVAKRKKPAYGWIAKVVVCPRLYNSKSLGKVTEETIFRNVPLTPKQVNVAIKTAAECVDGAHLLRLGGLSAAPMMLPGGRACVSDGEYESGGALYYIDGGGLTRATREAYATMDEEKAKATLLGFVNHFPCAGKGDLAGALTYLLTYLGRPLFGPCPVFVGTSPTPGDGKTLMALYMSRFATGRSAYFMTCSGPDREGETAKGLDMALVARDGMGVVADEAKRFVPNVELIKSASTAEEKSVKIRKMGSNDPTASQTARIDDLIVMFTGLNLQVTKDMTRRVCMIRLDRYEAEQRGWNAEASEKKLRELMQDEKERGNILAAALWLIERTALHH